MNEPVTAIAVGESALAALKKTRPWVKFLGIMSIIAAVLVGLDVLINGIGLLAVGMLRPTGGNALVNPIFYAAALVMFLFEAFLFVLWAIFQLRYSGAIRRLLEPGADGDSADAKFESAIIAQRNLWIMMGGVMLVLITLGIAFTVFALIAGVHLPVATMPGAP